MKFFTFVLMTLAFFGGYINNSLISGVTASSYHGNDNNDNSNQGGDKGGYTLQNNPLVGLYTFVNNIVGAPAGTPPYYGIITFHPDGTIATADTTDLGVYFAADLPSIFVSPPQGKWQPTTVPNVYSYFAHSFYNSAQADVPNPQLPTIPQARLKINGTVTLKPTSQSFEALVSVYSVPFADATLTGGTLIVQFQQIGTRVA